MHDGKRGRRIQGRQTHIYQAVFGREVLRVRHTIDMMLERL